MPGAGGSGDGGGGGGGVPAARDAPGGGGGGAARDGMDGAGGGGGADDERDMGGGGGAPRDSDGGGGGTLDSFEPGGGGGAPGALNPRSVFLAPDGGGGGGTALGRGFFAASPSNTSRSDALSLIETTLSRIHTSQRGPWRDIMPRRLRRGASPAVPRRSVSVRDRDALRLKQRPGLGSHDGGLREDAPRAWALPSD